MITLKTLNVTNTKPMSIKLNTKQVDITLYDVNNYTHATNNDIVPLVTNVEGDFKNNIINIISNSLGLTDSEIELYTALLKDSVYIDGYYITTISIVTAALSIIKGKSVITYRRGIDTLIRLGVIRYINKYTTVTVNPEYDVRSIVANAKFIVIELHTNV